MPTHQRGRILSVKMTKLGSRAGSSAMKIFSEAYEGLLQPSDGGSPIPYKSVYKVFKGDGVSYEGVKRAKNVKPNKVMVK